MTKASKMHNYRTSGILVGVVLMVATAAFFLLPEFFAVSYSADIPALTGGIVPAKEPALDKEEYDKRLLALAQVATSSPWYEAFLAGATSTTIGSSTKRVTPLWPTRTAYPKYGAILPFKRVIAYYGNFYSKQMGILGELPEEEVLAKLKEEIARWEAADPTTPVMPAIEYIDVTAQKAPGKDGKYRLRMPDSQIDKALAMAKKIDAIVILDIQVGLSTVEEELPLLETYLAMPEVHLALDPEFAMHNGTPPGRVIGTMDAREINYTINYLSRLVKEHNLPPKILVIHRFTEDMVTNYQNITPTPEVQVVVQMDGWGFPAKKVNTYNVVITPEPVQFAGIKVFYKNDLKQEPARLMTPEDILKLTPRPIFIQYQ